MEASRGGGTAENVRRYGGHHESHIERSWDGGGLEVSTWTAGDGSEGVSQLPDHLVFVTFDGRTVRTESAIDGETRYRGADFPAAVTFVPAGRRRLARHEGGPISYAAIRLDPAILRLAEPGRAEYRGFTNRPDPFVWQIAVALRNDAISGGAGGTLLRDSLTTALSVHLLRNYSRTTEPDGTAAVALTGRRLSRVLSHIHDHLADDLPLARLASLAGMNRHQFSAAFKSATGSSPHRFILERRVELAAELLMRPNLPIADIANRTGFSSQSHLTTTFGRIVGETPNSYRLARVRR